MTKTVKAFGPPQMVEGDPAQAMLQLDEGLLREAPLDNADPQ